MSKARFIQAVVARGLPKIEAVGDAIAYGEALWDALTEAGYGGPKADEPKQRERVDYYERLAPQQRAGFDLFWKAYDLKKGKNEAAMVWGKLTPDRDTTLWIVASAKAETKAWRENPPHGQTRIYPQGWLSALRWKDHPKPGAETGTVNGESPAVQKARLISELNGLRRMNDSAPNAVLQEQIRALEAKLNG